MPAGQAGRTVTAMMYQNFDLEVISPHGGDRLCARVLESPQGDCPFIEVKWPFDPEAQNGLLNDIYGGLRQRGARSSRTSSIEDFGGKLFEAVFSGDIEHLFRSSLDASFRDGKGLRIRLRLPEDSELHMQPWEFLFDTEGREFLAVREHTPLVRYLPVAQPIPPITVEGPLRVLVALSSPTDHPRLDIAREWEILCHALEPSITAGRLELRRVPGRCTFDNLRDSLRHFGAHIFHFVGHGIPGALVLEQESGKGLEMEATHLRSAFPSGALPRLIVLNACSGAITQDVPFSGLAQGFLRQGVPAVVAMQASITDDAALIFTRYFYRDLVEIGAVDASLTEARLRMQGNGHPIEWGTPVLYMRALSGQLFQPAAMRAAQPAAVPAPSPAPVGAAGPAPVPAPVPAPTSAPIPAPTSAPIPAPAPAALPDERKRAPPRTSAAPPRVEPTLNERKKTKDVVKQETPPPAPPSASTERKKTRTVRIKDPAASKPEPQEQGAAAPVAPPASSPAPSAPDGPPPQPKTEPARTVPAPLPAAPEPAPNAEPVRPAPAGPEAKPAVHVVRIVQPDDPPRPPPPPPVPPPPPAPAPAPAATQDAPPKAPPMKPAAKPVEQPVRPKAETKKHVPPPKLEPILDEPERAPPVQPPPLVPTFSLEPERTVPDQARPAGNPAPARPVLNHKPPPPAVPRNRRLVYGAAAGVVVLGLAVGLATWPSGGSTPAPESTVAPSAAPVVRHETGTIGPPAPGTAPAPIVPQSEAPPRVVESGSPARQEREAPAKVAATKPAPATPAPRKAKPAPAAQADNCNSPEVSERSANCVFSNK